MGTFLVIAGPLVELPPRKPVPLRWIKLPPSRGLEVREATAGLEAVEADSELASKLSDSHVLIAPLAASSAEHRPIRFRIDAEEGGLDLRVIGGPATTASVTDLDRAIVYSEEPRSVEKGRILRLRSSPEASYGMVLLDANHVEDEDALASALCSEAHALDALPDGMLAAYLAATRAPGDFNPSPWRAIDGSLRVRRELRAPFFAGLGETRRDRALRAWLVIVNRILHRHGFPASVPLGDEGRDWFFQVRAGIERVRGFPPLARDAFAIGVAQALDALGEEPGRVRLVPLARKDDKDHFQLTLSRQGDPEYRIFSVVRTERGDAVVSGRRVRKAGADQRVRAIRCRCGGRLYEGDRVCRGCGTKLDALGNIRVEGTFVVGATAEVAGLCECEGPLGAEDRFCGRCGRALEELR